MVFLNTQNPLLAQKQVRRALLLALPRDRVVQGPVHGQGIVAKGPFPPGSWTEPANAKPLSFNPEQAKKLLDQAGWKQGKGQFRSREGTEMRLRLLSNDDPQRIALGQEIVRAWRAVGINAELSTSGYSGLMRNFVIPRSFEALLYGVELGSELDPFYFWHSNQTSGAGFNFASYRNQEADRLLRDARGTTDRSRKAELYSRFHALFSDELPGLPLYDPTYSYVLDDDLKGVDVGVFFDTSSRFASVHRWHLQTTPAQN
jgi:peptide/nickel transport system substrate-binding protein